MLGFLRARAPGADGKPDPERVKAFSAANPETLNQAHFIAGRALPASFASTTYWGVHSFPVVSANGARRFIKFRIDPSEGEVTLSEEEAKNRPSDFLVSDLKQWMAAGGARFTLVALVGLADDPTTDVTVSWPGEDRRESVELGTIVISALEDNARCDESIFDPSRLADGVGHPPDEMFAARSVAYALSFSKRRSDGPR